MIDLPDERGSTTSDASTKRSLRVPGPPSGSVCLRLLRDLYAEMQADLARPHPYGSERVGFLSVATGLGKDGELIILGIEYMPIPDNQYVVDEGVGARIGREAIRSAIQRVLTSGRGLFHVHSHGLHGIPRFSPVDASEQPRLIASFRSAGRDLPHGMLVLSDDQANAWVWLPRSSTPVRPDRITIVGAPMKLIDPTPISRSVERTANMTATSDEDHRYSRQSFLGPGSQQSIERARIGIVGLGGGGSHISQQLAHMGFRHVYGFDNDTVSVSNLNRLVGATDDDVTAQTPKTDVALRAFASLGHQNDVIMAKGRWQDHPELLRSCDVVIGCVDSFEARRDLEVACRRYAIPYIDIGMDVFTSVTQPPRMAGQVILSMPGAACMWCLGFLTPERIAREAARYGDAGDRPQVIWPNGVLASSAASIVVDLVTGWTHETEPARYLSYDGNLGTLIPHVRLKFINTNTCSHYPNNDLGDPGFRPAASRSHPV